MAALGDPSGCRHANSKQRESERRERPASRQRLGPTDLGRADVAGFDLPEDYAAAVFDIYSEALSNVARHAGASQVAIVLTITPHEVTMVVRDDGVGLGVEAVAPGGGIAAIHARAQAHRGLCEVAGARNAGTTVTVSLPIQPASALTTR